MKVTGHVKERNGKLQLRAILHYDDGTTKERTKNTGLKDTPRNRTSAERQSEKWKAELLAEMEAEAKAQEEKAKLAKDPLFLDELYKWLDSTDLEIEENTRRNYKGTYAHHYATYPPFQDLRLSEVTPQIIMQYYSDKRNEGLSLNTVLKHHANFKPFFATMFMSYKILVNPMDRVEVGKRTSPPPGETYNDSKLRKLLDAFQGDPLEPVIKFVSVYGLRRSEAVGLLWKAVDLENRTFMIRRVAITTGDKADKLVERTKNKKGIRSFFLSPEMYNLFLQLKATQEENRKKFGSAYNPSGHVFCWEDGSPLKLDYISQHFKKVLDASGLEKIRFHDLRHTVASKMIHSGHDVKEVQHWLGHSRASTTLDIYSHLFNAGDEEIASEMSRYMYQGEGASLPPLPGEGTVEGTPA